MASDQPAFPPSVADREFDHRQGLKTLRDEFAMAAMAAVLQQRSGPFDALAAVAYDVANAMMTARKRDANGD